MNERHYRVLGIVILGFGLYYWGFWKFSDIMDYIDTWIHNRLWSYFLTYVVIGLPILVATFIIQPHEKIFNSLGLGKHFFKAAILSVFFTLPMFLGGFVYFKMAENLSIPNLIAGTAFAGLFEEIYFRGFLFGQVFKHTKIGFVLSIVVGALVFAVGHLYQSQNIGELVGIFFTTFLGAVFFAWLFVEWDYNLWVPIWLHTLMNLAWKLFAESSNAFGSLNSNIFRSITIALAIVVTIFYKKRYNKKMAINRSNVFRKI